MLGKIMSVANHFKKSRIYMQEKKIPSNVSDRLRNLIS